MQTTSRMPIMFEFTNAFADQIGHIFPKKYKRTPYRFEYIHRHYDDYNHIKLTMDSPTIIRLTMNSRRQRVMSTIILTYEIDDPHSMDQIEQKIIDEIKKHQEYLDAKRKRNKRKTPPCHI